MDCIHTCHLRLPLPQVWRVIPSFGIDFINVINRMAIADHEFKVPDD
jgi:hypothetical protein